MLGENPAEMGHNPAMGEIGHCGICCRTAFLAMLCSLALAASASAEAPAGPIGEGSAAPAGVGVEGVEVPTEPSGRGPAPETVGEVVGETAEGLTVGGGKETEGASEGAPEGGGGEEHAETVPPEGGGGEEHPESTPPAEETVVVETPVVMSLEETSSPAPTVPDQGTVEVATKALAGSGEEGLAGASSTPARTSSDSGSSAVAPSHTDSTPAQEPSAVLAAGLTPPPPTGPTTDRAEAQPPAASATATSARRTQAAITASQRAGDLSCELAALGGRTMDNCAVGWLGGKRFVEASTGGFDPRSDPLVANTSGGPPDNGHGGAVAGGAPISPAPGPAPSGASGAAVGGSSGVAPSAFLSLAGLLLLAAPRALRRLRLSCRPWLAAFFVLIPERPG
jgi:hypothetical protein